MRAALKLAMLALCAVAPGAGAHEDAREEANRKAVVEFYQKAINDKDFEAASKYLGPRYIQHNQAARDGPEGLHGFINFLREKFPNARSEIKRSFVDGDFVILHVHAVRDPATRGQAIVDIFRLEQGKIVEHWDVHEDISAQPANGNGMF